MEYGRIYMVKEELDGELRRWANITMIEEIADPYRVDHFTILPVGMLTNTQNAFLDNLSTGLNFDRLPDDTLRSRKPDSPVSLEVTHFDILMGNTIGEMPRIVFKANATVKPSWFGPLLANFGLPNFAWDIPIGGASRTQRMDDVLSWQP